MFSLQRDYGNAAVANVVQRRERPQSTDAPKTGPPPKKPPSPKAAPPPEDFAPTSANPKYGDWTDEALSTRAGNELDSTVKNSWSWAAELYEELWFRHKTRALATGPWRAYKKIGDAKREKFWEGVMLGAIKPGEKQPESQAGKEF
jgi:hypothetical protein